MAGFYRLTGGEPIFNTLEIPQISGGENEQMREEGDVMDITPLTTFEILAPTAALAFANAVRFLIYQIEQQAEAGVGFVQPLLVSYSRLFHLARRVTTPTALAAPAYFLILLPLGTAALMWVGFMAISFLLSRIIGPFRIYPLFLLAIVAAISGYSLCLYFILT